MNLLKDYIFKNHLSFKGNAGRIEFWIVQAIVFSSYQIMSLFAMDIYEKMVENLMGDLNFAYGIAQSDYLSGETNELNTELLLVFLFVFVLMSTWSLAVSFRRANEIGAGKFISFSILLPVIGYLTMIYLGIKGASADNMDWDVDINDIVPKKEKPKKWKKYNPKK